MTNPLRFGKALDYLFGWHCYISCDYKDYIIKIVQMSLKRLFSSIAGRLGGFRVKFTGKDPKT